MTRRVIIGLVLLGLWLAGARPGMAQFTPSSVFGNAAGCLAAAPRFATTRAVDTIYTRQAATTGVVYRVTSSGAASALIPVGQRSGDSASRITAGSGVGSVYGLAYDDGARSGIERLFVGAFTRRTASYGPLGPGGIYEYRFADASWRPSVTVPNAGTDRAATTSGDDLIVAQVSTAGLGDLEVSPDGRQLYVMNLRQRRIERYDITVDPPLRQTPLTIPFSRISSTAAVQADLMPFALEFHPAGAAAGGDLLYVGLTDRAVRSSSLPAVYVMSVEPATATWQVELRQPLRDGSFASRLSISNFQRQVDFVYPDNRLQGWYSWSTTREPLHHYSHQRVVFHPQPLLSDIEFVKSGNRMLLGLRDRVSDTQMLLVPPSPYNSAIGQGDVLGYRLTAGSWALISSTTARVEQVHPTSGQTWTAHRTDVYNDQVMTFSGSEPYYVENAQGALASYLTDGQNERVVWTALFGNNTIGLNQAHDDEAAWLGRMAAFTTSSNAAPIGDVELLCRTALIGGRVWFDSDRDGQLDAEEPRISGVTIEAYLPGSDQPAATSITNESGLYRFYVAANRPLRLRPAAAEFAVGGRLHGWYYTRGFVAAAGAADSDVSEAYGWLEFADDGGLSGQAALPPLSDSQIVDFDFGLSDAPPDGLIGDRVWRDADGDGLQGTGEAGLAGLGLRLVRVPTAAPSYRTLPLTQASAADGGYAFTAVEPGVYRLQALLPADLMPAPALAGNSERDSDLHVASAESSDLVVLTAQHDRTRDVGLQAMQADLQLTAQIASQVLVGDALTLTLSISSRGTSATTALSLTLQLPAELTLDAAAAAAPAADPQQPVWRTPVPAAGETTALELVLRAASVIASGTRQTVTLTAWLDDTAPQDDPANNRIVLETALVRPELELQKQAVEQVIAGDEIVYTLLLRNSGAAPATAVQLRDWLPDDLRDLTITTAANMQCVWPAADAALRCDLAELAAGHEAQLSYRARVATEAAAGLRNDALVETATRGDQPQGNQASVTTQVVRPDLQLTAQLVPSALPAGSPATLTLTVSNNGDGAAQAPVLTLTLPTALRLQALPDGCTTAVDGLICLADDLAAAATQQLQIALLVGTDDLPAQAVITATVESAQAERAATQFDNRLTLQAALLRPALALTLQAPVAIVGAGSVYAYELQLENRFSIDPSLTLPAESVVLTLTLPAEVALYAADHTATISTAQQLVWQLGTLAPLQTQRLTVLVTTAAVNGAQLTATAQVRTGTAGDAPQDNSAQALVTVLALPEAIPPITPTIELLMHSTHDPLAQDADAANAVHAVSAERIVWPLGEVLDLGAMIGPLYEPPALPWPYGYRLTPIGWSLLTIDVGATRFDARGADSRGLAGCRAGDRPLLTPELLRGCPYRVAADAERAVTEAALAGQAHLLWAAAPLGGVRDDVFVYRAAGVAAAQIVVELEVAIAIVNIAPGELAGLELPPLVVHELPQAERRRVQTRLTIDLLIPRSLTPASEGVRRPVPGGRHAARTGGQDGTGKTRAGLN